MPDITVPKIFLESSIANAKPVEFSDGPSVI